MYTLYDRTGRHARTVRVDPASGRVVVVARGLAWWDAERDAGGSGATVAVDFDGGPRIGLGARFGPWTLTELDGAGATELQLPGDAGGGGGGRAVVVRGRAARLAGAEGREAGEQAGEQQAGGGANNM